MTGTTTDGHDLQAFPNLSASDITVLASPERSITRAEAGLERSVVRAKPGVTRESECIGLTSRNASRCVWMFQGTPWEVGADGSNTQGTELMFRTKRENRTIKSKVQAWETRYPVGPTDGKSASRLSGGDMISHVAQQPTHPQGGHNGECCLKETDVETQRNGCRSARIMARGVRKLTVSMTHPDCRTGEWQCNADCAANMAIQTVQGASWVLSSVVHI